MQCNKTRPSPTFSLTGSNLLTGNGRGPLKLDPVGGEWDQQQHSAECGRTRDKTTTMLPWRHDNNYATMTTWHTVFLRRHSTLSSTQAAPHYSPSELVSVFSRSSKTQTQPGRRSVRRRQTLEQNQKQEQHDTCAIAMSLFYIYYKFVGQYHIYYKFVGQYHIYYKFVGQYHIYYKFVGQYHAATLFLYVQALLRLQVFHVGRTCCETRSKTWQMFVSCGFLSWCCSGLRTLPRLSQHETIHGHTWVMIHVSIYVCDALSYTMCNG